MKKSTFMKLFLMLLPILAVGLATTPDSVTVYDPQAGTAVGYSYFELVDVGALQMAAPLAAVLSLVSGCLAAVYLGAKKDGCLKGVTVVSFLSAVFAVLPVMFRGEVTVVPHVLLPIFMLAEAALSYVMAKKPVEDREKAPRLSVH